MLVLHALTGDAHVAGPAGPGHPTPGWWDGLVGPGAPIDTDRWFVVAPTCSAAARAPPAPFARAGRQAVGIALPAITIARPGRAEAALADALGIDRVAAVVGGSMGGHARAGVGRRSPRSGSAAWFSRSARWRPPTRSAPRAPRSPPSRRTRDWQGGDYYGTGRPPGRGHRDRTAHRPPHLPQREGARRPVRQRRAGRGGPRRRRQVRGAELPGAPGREAGPTVRRGQYVALTDALSSHDVGRGRGGVAAALGRVTVPAIVGGITSDRLYPLRLQQELADLLPTCTGLNVVDSEYGHDGFLVETDAVYELIRQTLEFASK